MTSWNVGIPDPELFLLSHTGITIPTVEGGKQFIGSTKAIVANTASDLQALVNEAHQQSVIAIDTETTGLIIWKEVPLFWSLSWGERRICLTADTLPYFASVFNNPRISWALANAKYDMHILANVGVHLAGLVYDVAVMHSLLYDEAPHDLKFMAQSILGWKWSGFDKTFGKIGDEGAGPLLLKWWANEPSKLIDYASNDAYGTMKLFLSLKAELESANTYSMYPDTYKTLWDIFEKIEVPFTRVLYECERNGVRLDMTYLNSLGAPIEKEIEEIEWEINKVVGRPLNPSSPAQLKKYFIEECGLKPVSFTKGGKSGVRTPSVDVGFLERYEDENVVAELILKHRALSKIKGTYVDGLTEKVDPHGRIHTRFNQAGTRTGRLSSSNPNLLC